MRFLIVGAGGIGCYYGARLQVAGHSVCYLARGEHLEAMQCNGLSVSHEDLSFHEGVQAIDIEYLLQHENCSQFDLIVLTLKSGATASILNKLSDWLKGCDVPILSLQNGVDNELLIAKSVGEKRTLGGLAVRIGGHITKPGEVEVKGPAQVIFGHWPNHRNETAVDATALERFAETFNKAGIPTQLSTDIQYELWRKLLINNGVNPLSALTGLDTKRLTSDPVFAKTVYRMMEEVAAVAKADQVQLEQNDIDEMFELISNFDAIKTSMLVDKEKARPLELDGISGAVIRRAKQLGIEVPVTELIHALLESEAEQLVAVGV